MLVKWMTFDNTIGTFLTGKNDHGHTSTRVGAAACEVEVVILLADLGCLEAVILFPVGHDTINRSLIGTIHAFDIQWSKKIHSDNTFAKSC